MYKAADDCPTARKDGSKLQKVQRNVSAVTSSHAQPGPTAATLTPNVGDNGDALYSTFPLGRKRKARHSLST